MIELLGIKLFLYMYLVSGVTYWELLIIAPFDFSLWRVNLWGTYVPFCPQAD